MRSSRQQPQPLLRQTDSCRVTHSLTLTLSLSLTQLQLHSYKANDLESNYTTIVNYT